MTQDIFVFSLLTNYKAIVEMFFCPSSIPFIDPTRRIARVSMVSVAKMPRSALFPAMILLLPVLAPRPNDLMRCVINNSRREREAFPIKRFAAILW